MNPSPETRLSLIGRLHNSQDVEAWAEFVQIYESLIRSIVQSRGLQYADAAEVTQDVLSRVATSINNWDADPAKGHFRGWLYRVTRNLTIDYLRRNRTLLREGENGEFDINQIPDPSAEDSREFRKQFERQLFNWAASQVQLTCQPESWQAFYLTTVEGVSVEEVAQELQMSPGAIYVSRSRMMKRLSILINKRLEETFVD